MIFKQHYLGCLAHASYMIASEGVAAVVDPRRDVDEYIEEAEELEAEIRYVVETHLHADFVSGHAELARRTGAEILIGERAGAEFPHRAVRDGDELRLGNVTMRALETPGHTPEGISWLLLDERGEPVKVLTGDTLFIGDVGRPDLAGGKGHTPEEMAGMLYDSLHEKLMTLPDSVEVWPAHGAGSACGKNISKERFSTIGVQKATNYALRIESREEFIRTVAADLPRAPRYFSMDAEINRVGARDLGEIPIRALDPEEAARLIANGATPLDTRRQAEFGSGHLPGSVNIGLKGEYASWAGSLLDPTTPIVLIVDADDAAQEATMRLARVGLENVVGYLKGGVEAWTASGRDVETLPQRSVDELENRLAGEARLRVVDVRGPGEYASGHVPGAISVPLPEIRSRLDEIPRDGEIAVICEGGYRSSAAASILRSQGFSHLFNVEGGTSAWRKAGMEVER
ncbi:MAG: MBL fold metallo-hydrolase [Acidobacteria bacterium]|nr:MBL fold metallo-hydrolase [Acidobacteriota bacterium]